MAVLGNSMFPKLVKFDCGAINVPSGRSAVADSGL